VEQFLNPWNKNQPFLLAEDLKRWQTSNFSALGGTAFPSLRTKDLTGQTIFKIQETLADILEILMDPERSSL